MVRPALPVDAVDAFDAVYRSHSASVFAIARLMTRNDHDAEDVAAEVMAKAIVQWRKDIPENAGGYLRRMVTNEVLNRRRRNTRWNARVGKLAGVPSNSDASEHIANRSALLQALDHLAPNARAAVVLRYWSGLNDQEIAEVLAVARGTVASLISRALPTLRAHLDGEQNHD